MLGGMLSQLGSMQLGSVPTSGVVPPVFGSTDIVTIDASLRRLVAADGHIRRSVTADGRIRRLVTLDVER